MNTGLNDAELNRISHEIYNVPFQRLSSWGQHVVLSRGGYIKPPDVPYEEVDRVTDRELHEAYKHIEELEQEILDLQFELAERDE